MSVTKTSLFIIACATSAIIIALSPSSFADNSSKKPLLAEKTVLTLLMKNADVLLKDAAFCDGVGIDENDRSIGDYFSGFWSFHRNKKGKNWLEISTSQSPKGLYLSKVMLYRKDGEENWGWGVSFLIDAKHKVKRDSFSCLGSG